MGAFGSTMRMAPWPLPCAFVLNRAGVTGAIASCATALTCVPWITETVCVFRELIENGNWKLITPGETKYIGMGDPATITVVLFNVKGSGKTTGESVAETTALERFVP